MRAADAAAIGLGETPPPGPQMGVRVGRWAAAEPPR